MIIKYRPIITDTIKKIDAWLSYWTKSRMLILLGDIGIGKTFTINYVAEKNGYSIIYLENKSDAKNIIARPVDLFGRRKLLHIDRPFTELNMRLSDLVELAISTRIPIVVEDTPDMYRYYQYINNSRKIRENLMSEIPILFAKKPSIYGLVRELKRRSEFKISSKIAGNDIRQLILMSLGSQPEESEDTTTLFIKKLLMARRPVGFTRAVLPLLLDNAEYFYGEDLAYLFRLAKDLDLLTVGDKELELSPLLWALKPITPRREYNNIYYEMLRSKEMEEKI